MENTCTGSNASNIHTAEIFLMDPASYMWLIIWTKIYYVSHNSYKCLSMCMSMDRYVTSFTNIWDTHEKTILMWEEGMRSLNYREIMQSSYG